MTFVSKEYIDQCMTRLYNEVIKKQEETTNSNIPSSSAFAKVVSASDLVHAIGIGWNLGNTLDATDGSINSTSIAYETSWGNPKTTKEMITEVKKKGFNAIRIPITWSHAIDINGDFSIKEEWLKRVREVVDYVIENDMICIINTHHDHSNFTTISQWLVADPDKNDVVCKHMKVVWSQIATYFKEYDNRLVFEGYNEVLTASRTWANPTKEEVEALMNLAKVFIDAVRETGGNNKERILCINTYGAMVTNLDDMVVPTDSVKDRLIVQVHNYDSRLHDGMEEWLTTLETKFIKHGYPVIVGEFGTQATTDLTLASRVSHARNYIARARLHSIKCFWWDNGVLIHGETYGLYDRKNNAWPYEDIVTGLLEGLTEAPNTIEYTRKLDFSNVSFFEAGTFDSFDGSNIEAANYPTSKGYISKVRLIDTISVSEGFAYNMTLTYPDNGFRFVNVIWYDANKIFIGAENFVDYTIDLVAPKSAKFMRFSIQNPWSNCSLAQYSTFFTNGSLTVTVSEYKTDEVREDLRIIPVMEVSDIDMTNINNWSSGEYLDSTGSYHSNQEKVCFNALVKVEANKRYCFSCSRSDIAIRTLSFKQNKIFDSLLGVINSNCAISMNEKTQYLLITMFSTSNNLLTYEDYKTAFTNGFVLFLEEDKELLIFKYTGLMAQSGQTISASTGLPMSAASSFALYYFTDVRGLSDKTIYLYTNTGENYLAEYDIRGNFIKYTVLGGYSSRITLSNRTKYIRLANAWVNSSTRLELYYKGTAVSMLEKIEKPVEVDKVNLLASIEEAKLEQSSVTVSTDGHNVITSMNWVTENTMSALNTSLKNAIAIYDDINATVEQVSTVTTALNATLSSFKSSKKFGLKKMDNITNQTEFIKTGSTQSANETLFNVTSSVKLLKGTKVLVTFSYDLTVSSKTEGTLGQIRVVGAPIFSYFDFVSPYTRSVTEVNKKGSVNKEFILSEDIPVNKILFQVIAIANTNYTISLQNIVIKEE